MAEADETADGLAAVAVILALPMDRETRNRRAAAIQRPGN
jgi:hypothetical protein